MAAYGSDNEGTDTIQAGDVAMGRRPRDSHVGPEGRHATDSGPEKKKKKKTKKKKMTMKKTKTKTKTKKEGRKEGWMDGRRRKKEKEEIVHTELCKLPRRSHFYLFLPTPASTQHIEMGLFCLSVYS